MEAAGTFTTTSSHVIHVPHRKKKEQEVEAHLFGDKPVYVTNAYRKHQEEQAKYEAELNKKCVDPPVPPANHWLCVNRVLPGLDMTVRRLHAALLRRRFSSAARLCLA